jgi:hypothetical protein
MKDFVTSRFEYNYDNLVFAKLFFFMLSFNEEKLYSRPRILICRDKIWPSFIQTKMFKIIKVPKENSLFGH